LSARWKVQRLLLDERGAVFTEYVAITGFVALVSIPAILGCALALAKHFFANRWYALMPFP
jgi:Flp pilus assembly pilin Flp